MKTRESVTRLFEAAKDAPWFEAVGEPIARSLPRDLPIVRPSSWSVALRVIRSLETENFLTESQNLLYEEQERGLQGTIPQRLVTREFNEWVTSIRPETQAIAAAACKCGSIPTKVGEEYEKILRWIIAKAAIVLQYNEIIKVNRLYSFMMVLLLDGHCVCGWEGQYPDGGLVVF